MTADTATVSLQAAADLSTLRFVFPDDFHKDLRNNAKHMEHVYDPKLQVLEFRDCLVNRHGFVRLSNGAIIDDIGYREMLPRSLEELSNPSEEGAEPLEVDEPLILVGGHENYYHWHLNWLPRLALADRFSELREVRPLILDTPSSFMRDSLEAVTDRKMADCFGLGWRKLRVSRLFVPAMFLNPMHAPFALDVYQPLRRAVPKSERTRIYISRGKARLRRVVNDAEVSEMLSHYGFQTVFAEELTYEDQVSLFSRAEFIIGAHGAGLTNMLFASPGFAAIELFNQYYTRVYWSLCGALGGKHYRQVSSDKITPPEGETDSTQSRKNADFIVDLEALRYQVEDVLKILD